MPALAIAIIIVICQVAPANGDEAANSPAGPVSLTNASFKLPPNTRWREERIMSAPNLKLSIDLGTDKNVKGTMSMLSRQLLDVDVLSTKQVRLKFVQNDTTSDIDFVNNRSRHTTTLPLDGQTVVAERGERGRWAAKFESRRRRPTAEESSALYALAYLWAEGIYPDRKVGVGESWEVDASKLKNLFGSNFKKPTGKFDFTLARIVEYEGQQCAKITGNGKLTSQTKNLGGAAAGIDETPLDAQMDLTVEIYRSIRLGMDISVNMTGTLELSNKKDEDALTYQASSPVEFTRTFKKR